MTRAWPYVVSLVLLCCGISASGATAETVFKKAAPSVVLIQDMEGHGSGVVLTAKGTILTSYHVVNTPFPIEVTAQVYRNGMEKNMTFKEVEVVSVHKEYDLAMVEVKLPPGVTMRPMSRSTRQVATGEDCFVIGNPGGAAGEALRNSITAGIISAGDRVVEGRSYIQTTAPINPGNSGGALVDRNSRLVGIISFIISDTEGIGFAIPYRGLESSDFVKQKDKQGDYETAVKYEKIGNEWYTRAQRLTGDAEDAALALAYLAFRLSLAELPNDPAPYNNLGNIYAQTGEYEKAKYFFQRAIELADDPTPNCYKMLGVCEEQLGNAQEADEMWKKGLRCKTDDDIRGHCAENLAITAIQERRFPEAAYLIKWANALGRTRPDRQRVRDTIYQKSANELSEKQFAFIAAKNDGFSFEEMAQYKAGRTRTGTSRPNTGRSVAAGSTHSTRAGRTSEDLTAFFKAALKDAKVPGPEGLIKKIPEAATDCRPAFGGVYLVMKFPDMKRLGVLSLTQGEFVDFIPISSPDCIYACGGRTLVIFDPKQKLFHTYDMKTLKRTGTKMSRIQGALTHMHMGLLTDDRAFVSWGDGSEALDRRHLGLLTIPDMKITPFRLEYLGNHRSFHCTSYRDNLHVRLDPGMKRFVLWVTSHSPSGFTCGRIDGLTLAGHYEHTSFGSLTLPSDPSRVIGSAGKVLSSKGKVLHDFKERDVLLCAVNGANLIVKVNGNKAAILDGLNYTEIKQFSLPFTMKPTSWNKNDFTSDRQIFASAPLNRVAFIDNSGLQVAIYSLAKGQNTDSIVDQLQGVRPGSEWSRKLRYAAGTRVKVEDAPDGVRYDAGKSELTWNVPRDTNPGSYQILISVKEPGKGESYQRVAITVR